MTLHRFLRAIGFSKIKTREDINKLVSDAVRRADKKEYVTIDNECLYAEYHFYSSEHTGICVRGEYAENNVFSCDYYFPFLESDSITSSEEISIERQLQGMSYSGLVDDYKLGISLIFYLRSIIEYLKYENNDIHFENGTSLTLSALSDNGTILMPILKDPDEERKSKQYNARRSRMLKEAAGGNEDAIESLSIQDIDTQNIVDKKSHEEDIYSLVDTYFMTYGLECELYSIMGEIKDYCIEKNRFSDEEIIVMTLDVNDIELSVCVNKKDVTGEIAVGRRYKGVIWLQGYINYPR